MQIAWLVTLALLTALSVRSAVLLGSVSPASAAGWWLTVVYALLAAAHALVPHAISSFATYVPVVLLTIAFVVAARRDERQAEPWWWPRGLGLTGAGRRTR